MGQLLANHDTVVSILSSRQASLQVVKGFWVQGDVRGALSAMLQAAGVDYSHQSVHQHDFTKGFRPCRGTVHACMVLMRSAVAVLKG